MLHNPEEKKEKKGDRQTVMCLILHQINGYLLPLGLILTEVRSSRVRWQLWRFLKSGRVSALRLKSQKWLKRFFLERPLLPDCIPRLHFFCLQIPWQAGMAQDSYKDLFYGEDLHENWFILMPNKHAGWSILFHFGNRVEESKLKVYKQMPNMQNLAVGDEYILLCVLLTSVREYSWHCQR